MLDVFAIAFQVEPKPGEEYRLEADPSHLYPATILHIQEVLKGGNRPDSVLATYYDEALKLTGEDWKVALLPVDQCPEKMLNRRALVLELARLWFTELVHVNCGHGRMTLHILKDPAWRLSPTQGRPADKQAVRFLGYSIRKE